MRCFHSTRLVSHLRAQPYLNPSIYTLKALAFFHFPSSHTSSDVKPKLLYMATPAPLVEWAFHTVVSTPNFCKLCLVMLPIEFALSGTKGGPFEEIKTGDPAATLLAVKATYLLSNVQGHKMAHLGLSP